MQFFGKLFKWSKGIIYVAIFRADVYYSPPPQTQSQYRIAFNFEGNWQNNSDSLFLELCKFPFLHMQKRQVYQSPLMYVLGMPPYFEF